MAQKHHRAAMATLAQEPAVPGTHQRTCAGCWAAPCGTRPMLVVPLLGRVVRVFNDWMALCTLCGSAVVVRPHHRYGGEIACMRCDPSMLYSEQEVKAAAATVEQRQSKVCRFCGK